MCNSPGRPADCAATSYPESVEPPEVIDHLLCKTGGKVQRVDGNSDIKWVLPGGTCTLI
jgi:hypothetical protein